MKKRRGFTLIELLVVMAIIATLAAIVVPNVARWISRARMTRAIAEIESIELSLTKLVSDTGRAGLMQMFRAVDNPASPAAGVYFEVGGTLGQPLTQEQFRQAQEIYTRTCYALLRDGRTAIGASDLLEDYLQRTGVSVTYNFNSVLDPNVAKNIGTSYLPELGLDPWGELYQIYPGPWPTGVRLAGQIPNSTNPMLFRTFVKSDAESNLPGASGSNTDGLQFTASVDGFDEDFNFPAPRDKIAFVYSTGQNTISGQLIYSPGSYPQPGPGGANLFGFFDPQEQEFLFGGDDINNWDPGQGWTRFYN